MKTILLSIILTFLLVFSLIDAIMIRELSEEIKTQKEQIARLTSEARNLNHIQQGNVFFIERLRNKQSTIDQDIRIIIQILELVEERFKQLEKQKNFDFRRANEGFRSNSIIAG